MEVDYKPQEFQASYAEQIKEWVGRLSILIAIVVLLIVFGLTSEHFLTLANFQNILKQISITAVLGIGMTMVILIGGIDLSVGSVVLCSAAVMNSLIYNEILPTVPAVLIGLLAATLVGFFNGVLIERAKISPVIVTLGTMIAIRGLGQMILWINNSWLWVRAPMFQYIKTENILAIPVPVVIVIVLYAIASFVMARTAFGRRIYAIGGNEKAAQLTGIPIISVKTMIYMISGFCAGIGGVLVSARLSAVSPGVGSGMEFEAVTAVILGGTSLAGGVGRVEKTILGAIVVGMVLNYLTIMGVSAHYQRAVTGFIILAAALLDRMSQGQIGE